MKGRPTRTPRAARPFAIAAAVVALAVALAAPATASAGASTVRALGLQHALANDVPLRNAPWLGTHNSYNSVAEMGPTLSNQDSNQSIDITAQLDSGVRSLELDLHWFPSAQGGGFAPVVCHARSGDEAHFGCTVEKPIGPVLDEIVAWLDRPANRHIVLLLYLEDHLEDAAGYDTGGRIVQEKLGDRLYRPPGGGACTELPWEMTRRDIIRSGAQVIAVSDCGPGTEWQNTIFSWEEHKETRPFAEPGRPTGYNEYPDCDHPEPFTRDEYEQRMIRYYEDHTQLTATVGTTDEGIVPQTAARMMRCGVDLIGLDHLEGPDDRRLDRIVWSWARGEPRRGRCALLLADSRVPFGRWFSRPCETRKRVACRTGDGGWIVPARAINGRAGRFPCRQAGASYAVPRTGYEQQVLVGAMRAAGTDRVWLGHRLARGQWWPLDGRG